MLLAYLAAAQLYPYGIVLCRGVEGHVAIEPAYEARCADSFPSGTVAQASLHDPARGTDDQAASSGCMPCSDTPLPAATSAEDGATAAVPAPPAATAHDVPVAWVATLVEECSQTPRPPDHTPHLEAATALLTTVVLIC